MAICPYIHESISSCDEHDAASFTVTTQLQEQQLESLYVHTYNGVVQRKGAYPASKS